MTSRKEITAWLSNLLMRDIMGVPHDRRVYWAREVTLLNKLYEPGKPVEIRPDFMKFNPVNQTAGGIDRGEFCIYEVKSCMGDFKSANGHNMIADKNYYVMTSELYNELHEKDKYDRFLQPNLRWSDRCGVFVTTPGETISQEVYDKSIEQGVSDFYLRNPFTGELDNTKLKLIIKSNTNRTRLYSNSELLFAMLRSSQKDKVFYNKDYWKDI